MDETLNTIHKLANERLDLYILAGQQKLSEIQQQRISQITNKLPMLWDQHRRELAGSHQPVANTRGARRVA